MKMTLDALSTTMVSALVGAFTVWVFRDFLIPQIGVLFSNGPKLHRQWTYRDLEGGPSVGSATIWQSGSLIRLDATRIIDRGGKSINRNFKYRGKITGRTIVAQYEQQGAKGAVAGAMVLRLSSDLKHMKGITSYYSDSAGEVISHPIFYEANV